MFDRRYLKGFLLVGLALSVVGCDSPSLVSIQVTPTNEFFSDNPGLTAQYTAIGTFTQGSHPKTTQDITSEVTWASSSPEVATISSTGLVTSVAAAVGTTTITASMNGFTGLIRATATAQVCAPGSSVTTSGC